MLGDVIKKGKEKEPEEVRVWKAKCRLEGARRHVVDMALAQEIGEIELEEAERKLENAEYEFLREYEGEDEFTSSKVRDRATSFVLWAILKLQDWFPEPMHPIFDIPRKWIHGIEDNFNET